MTLPGLAPSMLEPASLKELDLRQSPAAFADGVSLAPLEKSQARIEDAQRQLWASRSAGVLLVFHGLDASGKDSTLRRLTQAMDPMGVRVKGFGVPTDEEAAHDFLWRAWPHLPARGEVVIFNRSYYEAVLAERVLAGNSEQAADGQPWPQRYRVIREMEQHLAGSGTCILKFWLQVSAGEQRKRLLKRVSNGDKHWKFSPADVHSLEQRDYYLQTASTMIAETHDARAPWHLVPADDKELARRAVAERVADVLEAIVGPWPEADAELLAHYRERLQD